MIRLENIVLEYMDFKLGPLNAEFKLGEFISIVGPSGSGKSSLIKVITNHNKLIRGNVEYIGCNENDIMYISQRGTTFNHLNVRDNLRLKYDYTDDEITYCLEQVGLDSEYIDKFPFELSGGQRQRIDLVRALLSKSKYIILDESMSALDSENKKSISIILKKFVEEGKISIIYVTHDVEQAIEYSSRIISVVKGQVMFDNTRDEYIKMKEDE